jgi:hypothetical protein
MGLSYAFQTNHSYDSINIEINEQKEDRKSYRTKLKIASFKSNGKSFAVCNPVLLVVCVRMSEIFVTDFATCFAYDCLP